MQKELPRATGTRTTYTNTTLRTRPHTHRLAQIKTQKKRNKGKTFLLCRPGRPARSGRIAAKWRTLRLVRPAPLAARPFSSVRGTSAQLRSRYVRSARCPSQTLVARTVPSRSFVSHKHPRSRASPSTTRRRLMNHLRDDLDEPPNHRTTFFFFLLSFPRSRTNSLFLHEFDNSLGTRRSRVPSHARYFIAPDSAPLHTPHTR